MKKVHVDEIETLPLPWLGLAWKPVRFTLGVSAFGINAYHGANEGDLVVEEHADRHQELYLVVRGQARFRSGEEEFDAPSGTFVLFEPGEHRVAHAAEAGTTVVAIGADAERFEPSAWEFAFRAGALWDLGRRDEMQIAVDEGLKRYPDRADLIYSRACLRAAAGDLDAAREDLRRAIELFPGCADWARDEPVLRDLI